MICFDFVLCHNIILSIVFNLYLNVYKVDQVDVLHGIIQLNSNVSHVNCPIGLARYMCLLI